MGFLALFLISLAGSAGAEEPPWALAARTLWRGLEPPEIAQAGPVAFAGTPGLRVVRLQEPAENRGIALSTVLDVDTRRLTLKLVSAERALGKPLGTLPELLRALPAARAAMNAGFFNRANGEPIGLVVEEGEASGREHPTMDTVFFVRRDGSAEIAGRAGFRASGVAYAVAGKSAWPQSDEPTSRVAVCLGEPGHVRLAVAYPVRTLKAMSAFLSAEGGCSRWVHLDGGGSAQLALRDGERSLLVGLERRSECLAVRERYPSACFRPVANFLVVLPR